MHVFHPGAMDAHPYEQRRLNVFYQVPEFKMRIVELPPNGELPECQMQDHVVFYVLSGEADVLVDGEASTLREGQCLVSPPAKFKMSSRTGVRLMGIQIAAIDVRRTDHGLQ